MVGSFFHWVLPALEADSFVVVCCVISVKSGCDDRWCFVIRWEYEQRGNWTLAFLLTKLPKSSGGVVLAAEVNDATICMSASVSK